MAEKVDGRTSESGSPGRSVPSGANANRRFAGDLARAFGGAIIFSFPMLMTMEMWWLGFHMDRLRLALFLLLGIPLLVGLSHYEGFEDTFSGRDDLLDTFVAYAVGFFASALLLSLFGVILPGMSWNEIIGKVAVQTVPGALGAMFAQTLLGGGQQEEESKKKRHRRHYLGQVFLMLVGAIYLSFSPAATDEMVLIAYKMTEWHALGLVVTTLALMHILVHAVELGGTKEMPATPTPFWSVFLRYTIMGYAVALLVSAYVLWTFGRMDGTGVEESLMAVIVLGFPAGLGAAASRLIL